jgi:hypothetical protein
MVGKPRSQRSQKDRLPWRGSESQWLCAVPAGAEHVRGASAQGTWTAVALKLFLHVQRQNSVSAIPF